MAIRKQLWHDDRTREKIQTTNLVLALQEHAMGKRKMGPTQIRAAEILLRKTIPDLAQIEYTGEVTTRNVVLPEPLTEQQWNERFKPTVN